MSLLDKMKKKEEDQRARRTSVRSPSAPQAYVRTGARHGREKYLVGVVLGVIAVVYGTIFNVYQAVFVGLTIAITAYVLYREGRVTMQTIERFRSLAKKVLGGGILVTAILWLVTSELAFSVLAILMGLALSLIYIDEYFAEKFRR